MDIIIAAHTSRRSLFSSPAFVRPSATCSNKQRTPRSVFIPTTAAADTQLGLSTVRSSWKCCALSLSPFCRVTIRSIFSISGRCSYCCCCYSVTTTENQYPWVSSPTRHILSKSPVVAADARISAFLFSHCVSLCCSVKAPLYLNIVGSVWAALLTSVSTRSSSCLDRTDTVVHMNRIRTVKHTEHPTECCSV